MASESSEHAACGEAADDAELSGQPHGFHREEPPVQEQRQVRAGTLCMHVDSQQTFLQTWPVVDWHWSSSRCCDKGRD